MKIGILSMQKVVNYGSVLQAYSLREMIKNVCGEKAEFLDIEEEPSLEAIMPVQDMDDYDDEYFCENKIIEKIRKIIMYRLQKLVFFKKIHKFWKEDLEIADNDKSDGQYDLVFVGSDEVFKCTTKIRKQLYGEVNNAKSVVTYAASCGSAVFNGIPSKIVPDVRKCMSNFKRMSVRDKGTEEYVSSLYDGEIVHNLDPVLVGPLSKRKRNTVSLKNYMIVYAYNDRIRSKEEILAIKNFAHEHKLKTVCFGGVLQWCDLYIPADPFTLLDYFYNAEYIVTDTFHGTIFSIINHKKFVSIIRKTNKNKMSNLLSDLGLEERMLFDINQLEGQLIKDIDYTKVDSIIDKEREKSELYIKECIGLIS
ncbi:polysaccharide pyruvyl transferase family protein [Butyrivibrio sp. INlla16]|uniref:polysaccharide pyruvyl transferase family protein n=1 Tax=Butyrivibrio sp. INlla16 TaxID=1520807 RepID=UPI00088CCDCF|nr:polysaccharide pyruvyl transferase family protein [Butyrivibrio sp. INlla16]SDB66463.1 Polysaccharide pyruvyl transferase [Butyrivibrio sp. INlla16]